jgi:hypothetical protein
MCQAKSYRKTANKDAGTLNSSSYFEIGIIQQGLLLKYTACLPTLKQRYFNTCSTNRSVEFLSAAYVTRLNFHISVVYKMYCTFCCSFLLASVWLCFMQGTNLFCLARLEILTAAVKSVAIFWDIAPRNQYVNGRSGGAYHHHLQVENQPWKKPSRRRFLPCISEDGRIRCTVFWVV